LRIGRSRTNPRRFVLADNQANAVTADPDEMLAALRHMVSGEYEIIAKRRMPVRAIKVAA
jgi:hypothetical protein